MLRFHLTGVICKFNGRPRLFCFHTDHLGTPRVVTDKNNALRWRWLAEPFGTTTPENLGAFTQPLRFPGQYADTESGLNYNYFRDYDPSTGRYVESDPIGLYGGSLSTYTYVSSNSVKNTDFFGLADICNVGVPFSGGIPHTFICANGQCGGKHSGGDGAAMYSPTSQIKNDSGDKPAASCSKVPESDCDPDSFNKCVAQHVQPKKLSEPYFFAGANCGSWAVETIMECRKTCKKKQ
jgi:RHS repeat-associated protein